MKTDHSDDAKDFVPSELEEEPTQDESDNEFLQNDEEGTPGENHPNESPPTKRAKTNAKTKNKRKAWQWKKEDLVHQSVPEVNFMPISVSELTPLEFFHAMFGTNNMDLFVEETNRYGFKTGKDKVKPVSNDEMRTFIGILLNKSLVKLPQRRMYWSAQLRQEYVADYMTVNRFEEILMLFHLADNELQPSHESPAYDKLYKARQVLTNIQSNLIQLKVY